MQKNYNSISIQQCEHTNNWCDGKTITISAMLQRKFSAYALQAHSTDLAALQLSGAWDEEF